jgi:glycosyltransferase involved in cell wall biosynthesis
MAHKTLGIIVPVYNTEVKYLEACLDSLNQDDCDYAVVVVDDGSSECTGAWCNSFCEAHSDKYLYVRRDNGGQNAARLTGVGVLSCDYVTFVDSDDGLVPGAIGLINKTLKRYKPDLLVAGFSDRIAASPNMEETSHQACWLSRQDILAERSSLWGVVFRHSMVETVGLATGFHIGEDFASLFDLASRCESILGIDSKLYRYTVRPTSITQSDNYPYALEIIGAFDYLLDKDCSDAFMPELEWQAIKHLLFWEPLRLIRTHQASRRNKQILSEYMNMHFPKWKRNPYYLLERNKFGADFHLLVEGHWRLYSELWHAKRKLRELR